MKHNREKQIEEMALTEVDILANDLNQHCADLAENYCGGTTCLSCLANALTAKGYRKASEVAELEAKLADVTANWQKIHDAYDADCIEHYNKGRSEVAREIFEEIEKFMSPYRYPIIVELKKKYPESEKDNGN